MEKTTIKVMTRDRKTVVESIIKEVEIELPTEHKFYHWHDDSNFFGRGDVIIAILVRHKNYYSLYETERNIQYYTDFKPSKDCRQEGFMTSDRSIRRTAWEIITGVNYDFVEITKEEYLKHRGVLLDKEITEEINNNS
jgi:hypothetical protein